MERRIKMLLTFIILIIFLSSCSPSPRFSEIPIMNEETRLVIYTSHKKEVYGPIIDEFQSRTGRSVLVVDGAAIVNNVPNRENAQLFIDFILSKVMVYMHKYIKSSFKRELLFSFKLVTLLPLIISSFFMIRIFKEQTETESQINNID